MHKFPSASPTSSLFSSSTITGCIPKKGLVAAPGLVGIAPGSGVINIPPVSVCHHVSTMGHFDSPTTL